MRDIIKLQNKKEKGLITMSKLVEANEKIAEVVVEGYKKIENYLFLKLKN